VRATSHRERTGLRVAPLLLGAIAVLAFGVAVVPRQTRAHLATILSGRSDESGNYRIDVARDTLRLAAAHPVLGAGLGAYADAFPAFKRAHGEVRTTHAEDDALEFVAETGLAGLALAAWLATLAARSLLERLRHGHDPFRKSIAVGAASAVASLAVHSLFDFNLHLPANALVCASLAGLAASAREAPNRVGSRALSAAAAVVLTVACGLSAWRGAGATALEAALRDADPQMRVAALDSVLGRHPYLGRRPPCRGLPGAICRRPPRAGGGSAEPLGARPRPGGASAPPLGGGVGRRRVDALDARGRHRRPRGDGPGRAARPDAPAHRPVPGADDGAVTVKALL
jgi:hypothetical protein